MCWSLIWRRRATRFQWRCDVTIELSCRWTLDFPSGGRWIFRVVDVGFSELWTCFLSLTLFVLSDCIRSKIFVVYLWIKRKEGTSRRVHFPTFNEFYLSMSRITINRWYWWAVDNNRDRNRLGHLLNLINYLTKHGNALCACAGNVWGNPFTVPTLR